MMKQWFCFGILVWALFLPVQAGEARPLLDGQYEIEVTLSGGSGRATVESPATLNVNGGAMTAVLVWSSPYYDRMFVDGVSYDPIRTEGGATFEVPVWLDEPMAMGARTVAMSQPHTIDYTLQFDSATIQQGSASAQTPWNLAAVAVVAIILLAAVAVLRQKQRNQKRTGREIE